MVNQVSKNSGVSHVNNVNGNTSQARVDSKNNTVDMKHKTSQYLETASRIQKAIENLEVLKATNPQRYNELKKVLDNTSYTIMDNGDIEFQINGTINPKDFIIAYGIPDGGLIDTLDDIHKSNMSQGKADAVPQGKGDADDTLLWFEEAADVGESIEFTDGMRYTKARGWLSGEIFYKRDCTKMRLHSGDSFSLPQGWITNKRDVDDM